MKVLRFYAEWCDPCKRVSPLVEAMASRYALVVESVDVDDSHFPGVGTSDLVERYNVKSVPTFVVVDDSGNPVYTGVGAECIPTLQKALEGL